jgi:Glycerol uptake facilitator and related permeases (Major Intrinsic Protein Family)
VTGLSRRLAGEALGTGLLLATVVGSGIMADRLTADVALALLCNTIPTGAILFVLITVLGPVSGGHFNPAVSLVAALRRDLPWTEAGLYAVVQVLGGIVGMLVAHAMFELPLWQWGSQVRSGGGQWLSEGMATFGLVLVILLGMRLRATAVPALVGLYITAAYWFTASTSFANPAVTLARALTESFSGIRPVDAPGFILAQIAGALLALGLAGWLLRPMEEEAR